MGNYTVFLFLASPPLIIIAKGWAGGNRVGFVQSNSVNMGLWALHNEHPVTVKAFKSSEFNASCV